MIVTPNLSIGMKVHTVQSNTNLLNLAYLNILCLPEVSFPIGSWKRTLGLGEAITIPPALNSGGDEDFVYKLLPSAYCISSRVNSTPTRKQGKHETQGLEITSFW